LPNRLSDRIIVKHPYASQGRDKEVFSDFAENIYAPYIKLLNAPFLSAGTKSDFTKYSKSGKQVRWIVQQLEVSAFLIARSGIETTEPERAASVPQDSATRCAWAKKPYPGT
jgi:hypothetical protein